MGIIGDIKGKTCIINDDMIDTAGTLCANVKELKAMGAGDIYVCATHGIFSGPAIERLNDAPIVECVVTDASPSRSAARLRPSRSPRSSLRPSPPFTTRSPSPRSSAATSRCSRIVLATRRIAAETEETPTLPLASQRSRGGFFCFGGSLCRGRAFVWWDFAETKSRLRRAW